MPRSDPRFALDRVSILCEISNTHIGKYECKVLPMGLCNAPAVFQSAMNQTFGGLLNRCVFVYLDDILIFSKTEEEHLSHLEQVLALLHKHDWKVMLTQ